MKYIITPKDSINVAIRNMEDNDILFLKKGIYREKVISSNNNIIIEGESENETIIENKDFYHKIMSDYNECNTFRTFSVLISGNNVTLKNLTITNNSVPSSKYGQAVALSVLGDNFKAENVTLKSAQDTLFTGPIPENLRIRYNGFLDECYIKGFPSKQIYKNCTIYGDVDFIFGGATALFYKCNIVSLNRHANNQPNGYLTAPSHSKDLKYGYLFYKCNLNADENTKDIYLSRPWRDYGMVAFIDNNYNSDINHAGFNKWDGTERDKTARFSEYSNSMALDNRVKWAKIYTEKEKNQYLTDYFNYIGFKEED